MNKNSNTKVFSFEKAAIYKIVIQGEIDLEWSNHVMGLQVNVSRVRGKDSVTTLIGQINDQSALSGILTTLNDLHMTVISVNMLTDIENV